MPELIVRLLGKTEPFVVICNVLRLIFVLFRETVPFGKGFVVSKVALAVVELGTENGIQLEASVHVESSPWPIH